MTIKAHLIPNGPIQVSGDLDELQLTDGENRPIEVKGKAVYLCRCGGSVNKPFCDGTHSKIGFQAAEAAVSKSG